MPRTDSRFGQLDDYILPEMLIDPWIELYGNLPESLHKHETSHLTAFTEKLLSREFFEESAQKRPNLNPDP